MRDTPHFADRWNIWNGGRTFDGFREENVDLFLFDPVLIRGVLVRQQAGRRINFAFFESEKNFTRVLSIT